MKFDPGRQHFFGKSSSFMLLQKAMDIREEFTQKYTRAPSTSPLGHLRWGLDPVCRYIPLVYSDLYHFHSGWRRYLRGLNLHSLPKI